MFVAYIDDGIFVSQDSKVIDSVIKLLQTDNFDLTREGNLSAYLGVKIKKEQNSELTLLQLGLIDQIIAALGLEKANCCQTLAE